MLLQGIKAHKWWKTKLEWQRRIALIHVSIFDSVSRGGTRKSTSSIPSPEHASFTWGPRQNGIWNKHTMGTGTNPTWNSWSWVYYPNWGAIFWLWAISGRFYSLQLLRLCQTTTTMAGGRRKTVVHHGIVCFTLLLARHLADVSCYIGPSMPSGICMEIHTEIVQKRKKKPSHNRETPRQPHVYL